MSLLPKTMKQWVLASRPVGVVKHDDFALQQADVPNISENEVLLKTLYLGVAPVMQRYMIGASIAVARYWGEPSCCYVAGFELRIVNLGEANV